MNATKRLLAGLLLGSALAIPGSAGAQTLVNGTTYQMCGGISYTFCGMAHLDITSSGGVFHVALTFVNRSGIIYNSALTRTGAEFVSVGLENIIPTPNASVTLSNFALYTGTWDVTTSTFTQTGNACLAAVPSFGTNCWNVQTYKNEGGGVNVDFDASTATGNKPALSSQCIGSVSAPLATSGEIFTCGVSSNYLDWRPVQINFDVNEPITGADLYVKAIDKTLRSTECLSVPSGRSAPMCDEIVTTPEPASLALLGTGLLGIYGAFRRRRYAA